VSGAGAAVDSSHRFRLYAADVAVEIDCDSALLCRRLRDALTLAYQADEKRMTTASVARVWISQHATVEAGIGSGLAVRMLNWSTHPLMGHRGNAIGRIARSSFDGIRLAQDLETQTWYLTDTLAGAAHLVRTKSPRFAGEVRRYLNGLFTAWLRPRGFLLVHAAAVRLGDLAVIAVGSAGAGKTTVALSLMESFGAQLASNDTLLLRPARDEVVLHGRYGRLRVWPATLAVFRTLQRAVPRRLRPADTVSGWPGADKISVGSGAVRAAYGSAYLNGVRRVAVVFPRFEPGVPAKVERIAPPAGVRLLRENLLPANDHHAPWRDLAAGLSIHDQPGQTADLAINPAFSWYRVSVGSAPLADLAPRLADAIPELVETPA
jgi:hypothetical protein